MDASKQIFRKSVAIFFIGLMMLASCHNLIEHHSEYANNQRHFCVLCHQVMVGPSPPIYFKAYKIRIEPTAIIVLKIEIHQLTRIAHLFLRGPPLYFHLTIK